MKIDRRYSVQREFCGHAKPRWVVRWCGEWVGHHLTRAAARVAALEHRAAWCKAAGIE